MNLDAYTRQKSLIRPHRVVFDHWARAWAVVGEKHATWASTGGEEGKITPGVWSHGWPRRACQLHLGADASNHLSGNCGIATCLSETSNVSSKAEQECPVQTVSNLMRKRNRDHNRARGVKVWYSRAGCKAE